MDELVAVAKIRGRAARDLPEFQEELLEGVVERLRVPDGVWITSIVAILRAVRPWLKMLLTHFALMKPGIWNSAGGGAMSDGDSLPTRASLLSRLRDLGDSDSWREFFETYWRLIYNVARKAGLSDDAAQDVVQETVIAVARKMPEFRYDPAKGSFKQWLLLITRRRIHDQLRRQYRSVPIADGHLLEQARGVEEAPAPTLPPDAQIDAAWEQ